MNGGEVESEVEAMMQIAALLHKTKYAVKS